ncbi:MAG: PAS domain S-box protein [Chloroflexota bacterium]
MIPQPTLENGPAAWSQAVDLVHLSTIVRLASDAIISVDANQRIILFNKGAEQTFGYSAGEALGQPLDILLPPHLVHSHHQQIRDFAAGPVAARLMAERSPLVGRYQDGALFPIEASIIKSVVNGQVVFTAILRNIAERQESQAERDFALQVMNAMGQGLTVTNADLRFEYVNPAYARMVGYETKDLIGKSPSDVTFPEDHDILTASLARRRAGETTTYETRLRHADGRAIHALITGVPRWRDGRVAGAIAVVTDLTGYRQVEAALQESEAKNRALLRAIPDMIFRNRRDGTYLDYHAPNQNELAVAPSAFLGKKVLDVLPPAMAQQSMYHIERALQTGATQVYKYPLTVGDTTRYFEARMVVSGPDEVLTIVRDISEQTRLEQMKSDFINRAAHELRTPLTTTIMMANLIQEGGAEEELRRYWSILNTELERQRNLVEELLKMGRLESDTFLFSIAPLDLAATLEEALKAIAPLANAKPLGLSVEIAPQLPLVNGDKSSLQQVFVNLLNNAVKFTPPGGAIRLLAFSGMGGVTVQVHDTGIGIPSEDLPHLFSRFFRASNATINEIPGSGVGLYTVKAIVEKLGGHVRVESQLNQGTTFEVWLPGVVP